MDTSPLQIAANADSTASHVSVVSTGGEFLVLWTDPSGAVNITSVQPDGPIITPAAPLTPSGQFPSAACSTNTCLAVWNGKLGLEARRIRSNGSPLDSEVITIIHTGSAPLSGPAAVATDGSDFLVVWAMTAGGMGDIFGARVSAAGVILDRPSLDLAWGPGDQSAPAVAFDGQHYLTLWHDDEEHLGTYGIRVHPDGRRLDLAPLPINPGHMPSVAFAATGGLVTSLESSSSIIGTSVNQHGRIRDFQPLGIPDTPIGHSQEYCEMDYQGTRSAVALDGVTFLVAWDMKSCDPKSPKHEIKGAFIKPQVAMP